MALSQEAYTALEDIVGPVNVSRDPACSTVTPCRCWPNMVRPDCSHYLPRGSRGHAGVHRRSAEDSPAGQHTRLRSEAPRHGLVPLGSPMYDDRDTVQLDLRRMNKIEIDEKNGIAVVEPCVIHAQLHAEAIKRGWSCK